MLPVVNQDIQEYNTICSFSVQQQEINLVMAATKGNQIELRTFLSYGKSDILGYKTEEVNGRVYVNFCWCKVCAKNKDGILQNPTVRGNTKSFALAFINGTNVVTKYQAFLSVNDKNWSPEERDETIERATEIYLEKRRKITRL